MEIVRAAQIFSATAAHAYILPQIASFESVQQATDQNDFGGATHSGRFDSAEPE